MLYEGPYTPKQILPNDKLYSVWLRDGQPIAAALNWRFLPTSSVCTLNSSLNETLIKYRASVSHCIVEGEGLLAQDGASITVRESGILDFRRDGDWPASVSNGTNLIVRGMVTKTGGTGYTTVTTDYDEIVGPACVKSLSGTLYLDFQNYSMTTSEAVSHPATGIAHLHD